MVKRFADARVARVFRAYPPAMRRKLMRLRALIFDTATATDGVGELRACIALTLTYRRRRC